MSIQPRSNSFRWERYPNEIKFWLTSSPTQGKANKELLRHIASICKIPSSEIQIVAGWKSRRKIIDIQSEDFEDVNNSFSRD